MLLNRGGYIISPGTETFMRLTKRAVTRLGKPHGTCRNVPSIFPKYHKEHYETVRECIQRQMIDAMFLACECIPWYVADRWYTLNKTHLLDMGFNYLEERVGRDIVKRGRMDINEDGLYGSKPSIYSTKYAPYICNFIYDAGCQSELDHNINKDVIELQGCPEPCAYNEWGVDTSTTAFPPTEPYYRRFMQKETGGRSFEYATNNIARLHIYYDDIKIDKIDQVKAYELQNFIAELGGTFDLFVGFSCFTVFQVIEIGVAIFVYKRCCRVFTDVKEAFLGNGTVACTLASHAEDRGLNPGRMQVAVDHQTMV